VKQVTLLYFAQLASQAGCGEEQRQTEAQTLSDLFHELKPAHGWDLSIERIRFARNDAFCSASETINDGDTLAIMPPMSGG